MSCGTVNNPGSSADAVSLSALHWASNDRDIRQTGACCSFRPYCLPHALTYTILKNTFKAILLLCTLADFDMLCK